jgi:hypothetical protein
MCLFITVMDWWKFAGRRDFSDAVFHFRVA